MRLGKKKEKEKDAEPKSQVVEGINRLVCQAKTHHSLLKGDAVTARVFVQFSQFSHSLVQW